MVIRCRARWGVPVVAVLWLSASSLSAETIDRVLAVVAGQIITLTDVNVARDLGVATPAGAADPVRAVLSQLIDRQLMLNEVDRYAPPEPATDAIEQGVAAIRSRFPTAAEYADALARSGVDDRYVRELVRQSLRIREYQDQRFSPADPRRDSLIEDWLAGLRKRGDILDIYANAP
jgi:hypothetical protein